MTAQAAEKLIIAGNEFKLSVNLLPLRCKMKNMNEFLNGSKST